jgi:hypothetical protein
MTSIQYSVLIHRLTEAAYQLWLKSGFTGNTSRFAYVTAMRNVFVAAERQYRLEYDNAIRKSKGLTPRVA